MKLQTVIGSIVIITVSFTVCIAAYFGIQKVAGPDQALQRADSTVGGSPNAIGQRYLIVAGASASADAGDPSATTTKTYLTTGQQASSTITGSFERGDRIDLKLRAVASSSAAQLKFVIQMSDTGTANEWYSVDESTTTGSAIQTHQLGDVVHTWPLATSTGNLCGTNEICKDISLPITAYAKYFRIQFGVSGANTGLWGYATVREQVGN